MANINTGLSNEQITQALQKANNILGVDASGNITIPEGTLGQITDQAFLCKHIISMVINNVAFTFSIQNYRSTPYTNASQLDPQNLGLLHYITALKDTGGNKQTIMITQTIYSSSDNVFGIVYDNDVVVQANCNNIQIADTVQNVGIVSIDMDKIAGIIESGSNSYGNWTKFADGTMICTGYFDVGGGSDEWSAIGAIYYKILVVNKLFPNSFVLSPNISASIENAYLWVGGVNASSTKITSLDLFSGTTFNGFRPLKYIAIGRWK